ncbi:hypothetical protein [Gracilibacillus alcaliphilus]|uniref:hypothetical protein n=1 Tax=Gracilibacillus alcaliphilus TaxID=1401441 RepID=UPI00195EED85|nr:hypothetical protein [Gracilibacillus alcaliphilus]MBM7677251.1 hypothetical protein [Gracilibacillus alcaliphilus]
MKSRSDQITIYCFYFTLICLILAWINTSFLFTMLTLASVSVALFTDAAQEWRKGNRFFFSQSLVRGFGVVGGMILIYYFL